MTERIGEIAFSILSFKHDWPEDIARYAAVLSKNAEQAGRLRA